MRSIAVLVFDASLLQCVRIHDDSECDRPSPILFLSIYTVDIEPTAKRNLFRFASATSRDRVIHAQFVVEQHIRKHMPTHTRGTVCLKKSCLHRMDPADYQQGRRICRKQTTQTGR